MNLLTCSLSLYYDRFALDYAEGFIIALSVVGAFYDSEMIYAALSGDVCSNN